MFNKLTMKTFALLLLIGLLAACRPVTPDPVKPAPIPTKPVVDLLKTDPASLIEGLYVGSGETRTPTRYGVIDYGISLLVRRLDSHRILIDSPYGQMNTYKIQLISN